MSAAPRGNYIMRMNFLYYLRLPGFVAFAGVAAGVCAARFAPAAFLQTIHDAGDLRVYMYAFLITIIISAAAGILLKHPALRFAFFAICGFCLLARAELDTQKFYARMDSITEHKQIFTLTVRISSPVAQARSNYRFRGEVVGAGASDAEIEQTLLGRTLQFTSRDPVPPYGTITVQGRYAEPRRAAGPVGYDEREHFAVNNLHGNFRVSRVVANAQVAQLQNVTFAHVAHRVRMSVHSVINRAENHDVRAIFHAAFLGEREHLTGELNTAFRKSGIIHLLAISGFHAALLYSAIYAALAVFALSQKTKTLISLAALWCYLPFIGFIPSLFRATVMVSFFCVTQMIQRKNHPVQSLGAAGAAWLFMSPHSLFAPGFQLSFAATAGIILFPPILKMITDAVTERVSNEPLIFLIQKFASPFWVSAAGFAATAPPLLHHFGAVSLYGIFFNVVAIPLMSVAMWLFFAAIVLSPIAAASHAAVWCAEQLLNALIYMAKLSEHVAWSEIIIARITTPQLLIAVIFMMGLCVMRPAFRGVYALRAGAAAMLLIAGISVWNAANAQTVNKIFTRESAKINLVIHPNNSAWIIAQGGRQDVRQLRLREIEPFLRRQKIREVPLFVVNAEAEQEAHEFTFANDFAPQIIVTRSGARGRGAQTFDNYTIINARTFVSAGGACTLRVDDGGVKIILRREP